jgi:hypothetical protein
VLASLALVMVGRAASDQGASRAAA